MKGLEGAFKSCVLPVFFLSVACNASFHETNRRRSRIIRDA